MTIAVVGIGNVLAADDGAGIRVVEQFRRSMNDTRIRCAQTEEGGLDILGCLEGCDKAIIIDAAQTNARPAGSITSLTLHPPFTPASHCSLHPLGVDAVLAFGSMLGMRMPDEVTLYAIEGADVETFGGPCSREVSTAIPEVVALVRDQVHHYLPDAPAQDVSNEVKSP